MAAYKVALAALGVRSSIERSRVRGAHAKVGSWCVGGKKVTARLVGGSNNCSMVDFETLDTRG